MENRRLNVEQAKKLICCAINMKTRRKCDREAVLTLRIESGGGPEYITFCSGHIHRAPMVIDELERLEKYTRLP